MLGYTGNPHGASVCFGQSPEEVPAKQEESRDSHEGDNDEETPGTQPGKEIMTSIGVSPQG